MSDNPYRAPSMLSLAESHTDRRRRQWFSDAGLVALSAVCGGAASVVVFGGEYLNANRDVFGFGGLALLVFSVSAVSACRGLRHPPGFRWLTCVTTSLAGIVAFLMGVPAQMSRTPSGSDGRLLFVVSGLTIALSLAGLVLYPRLRRHGP